MKKKCFLLIVSLVLSVALSGCSRLLVSWDPNTFDSSGKRIGVCVAWEADYALTPRRDIKIYRFDTNSDAITSLVYGNVDAVCMDNATASESVERINGLTTIPSDVKSSRNSVIFNENNKKLYDEFNEFLVSFLESEAGKAYQDNINQTIVKPDTEFPYVPPTADGPELTVGVDIECYPFSYVKAGSNDPLGFNILILNEFANAYNYRLKYVTGNYEACELGTRYGTYDMSIGSFSDFYKEELEDEGILVSDPYLEVDMVYIIVSDGKNLGYK